MNNFIDAFSNLETNTDMDDISNKLIKIKIKIKKQKYISFIPAVIGDKYDNKTVLSISLNIFNLYLALNNKFEIYDDNDANENDINLLVISIFNISFNEILQIKKIQISNIFKIYLIIIKNTSVIPDVISEKWTTFFKFGDPMKKSNIILESISNKKINLKLGDILKFLS
jgi:hypothetical protein